MGYQPSKEILEKYADVLVNFALGSGKGVKKGEVVMIQVPECAKPFLIELRKAVLRARAHPIINYLPDGIERDFYETAQEHHLDFFPSKYIKGRVDEMDHLISIIAEHDMRELNGIDAGKIMRKSKAFKPYFDWRNKKENEGKFTWTLALYGTEAMAKEAGLGLEDYWEQIIKSCYLDFDEPVKKWKEIFDEIETTRIKLSNLQIEKLRVKARNVDLIIGIGKNRKWMGGSGRNIPSFELFISPDCRIAEGFAKFDQPLYRYGNLISGVFLEFKNGQVVKAEAEQGENILKEMIASDNGGSRIGEFSLTDVRLSRITKFMASTLFDENLGGDYGNFHIALGNAYKDSYPGNIAEVSEEKWKEMGYNDSVVHTDIVSGENREVTAYLEDGSERVIYKDGKFQI